MAKERNIPIRHNAPRYPMEANYLSKEQISYVHGIICFMTWNGMCHLIKPIYQYLSPFVLGSLNKKSIDMHGSLAMGNGIYKPCGKNIDLVFL